MGPNRWAAFALFFVAAALILLGLFWEEQPADSAPGAAEAPAASAPGTPEGPIDEARAIRGRVTADGAPVRGAKVVVYLDQPVAAAKVCECGVHCGRTLFDCPCDAEQAHGWIEQRRQSNPRLAKVFTDAEGRFTLPDLNPKAGYEVWADADGFRSQKKIAAHAGDARVEFLLERSAPNGGRVTNASQRGVGNAKITVMSLSDGRPVDVLTAGNGSFSFPALPLGDYLVTAQAESFSPVARRVSLGGHPTQIPLQLSPAVGFTSRVMLGTEPATNAAIEISGDDRVTKLIADREGEFHVKGFPARGQWVTASYGTNVAQKSLSEVGDTMQLRPAGELSISAVDERGKPLRETMIRLTLLRDEQGVAAEWFGVAGTTDQSGTLRVLVPTGIHQIDDVQAPGRTAQRPPAVVEIAPGTSATVRLAFTGAHAISGRVLDSRGEPISGAYLVVRAPGASRNHGTWRTTGSLGDGTFCLEGLPREPLTLEASHVRFLPTTLEVAPPRERLDIVLGDGASIVGLVVDPRSGPSGRAQIFVGSKGAMTNEQGEFTIAGMEPGNYDLFVVPRAKRVRSTHQALRLTGSGETRVRIELPEALYVSGQLLDADSDPLPREEIVATPVREADAGSMDPRLDRGLWWAMTGADGSFEIDRLEPGRYTLSVRKEGFQLQGGKPVVAAGTRGLALVLEPERRALIRGRVLTTTGEPVREFGINGEAFSSRSGRFEVESKSENQQILFVTAPGLAPAIRTIHVQAGERAYSPDIILGPERLLRGKVVDARSGAPLKAWVTLEGIPTSVSKPCDADGRFTMSEVDGDPTKLSVSARHYVTALVDPTPGQGEVLVRLERIPSP